MGDLEQDGYWAPEGVRAYLRGAGYSTRALEDMEPHIREWDSWMRAVGEFYDYRDTDGLEGCIRCTDGPYCRPCGRDANGGRCCSMRRPPWRALLNSALIG